MTEAGRELSYPADYFRGAYLRGALGLGFAVIMYVLLPASPIVLGLVVLLGLPFALYIYQTRLRQMSQIRFDTEQIWVAGPQSVRITWAQLGSIHLAYYSTRKDGRNGWMQLKLQGGGSTLRFESDLDGFEDLASFAYSQARRLGLDLDIQTRQNMKTLLGRDIDSAHFP